ncbi:hypothetical protein A2767_04955 [Candidatus Roizmanbacteria bacterium RIFCSPHIGHO2_01_FULL_35_10]|uniref:peptidylprolyl isomerase n=1 Tax=Candidatus Roizmanbacteria bacterium RIFCSPLOWO2_01_FULL_35_13 TaxID=1802055 RepID=A0A1F7I779_9BACT|nr:MAG: hypothetical protein A2767_04955 [Candidatus Roizmanbacteria bacterium RIFCSPHIGHO2_01_FULL_35_10]OGK39216.1 MAG: hypothetical protein A3A74_07700 [Candidatus Roizmanbacteria bacterium RIFCSPLOWO2_01_FULL_35_13]
MKNPKLIVVVFLLLIIAFFSKSLFFAAMVNGKLISRLSIIKDLEKRGGKQVLDSLVSKELILQEAAKKNVNITKEDIEKRSKEIEKSTEKQGQKLDQLLTMQGMTRADFESQLQVQLLLEKILADKIKVSDKEIDEYLKKLSADTTVTGLTPTPTPPARNEVRDQLRQQKLQTEAQKLVDDLKKSAKISTFVNY